MAVSTTTRRRSPTPFMKIGTHSAYAVLQWVRKQVLAEPKRLNMWNWVTMFQGKLAKRCDCAGCAAANKRQKDNDPACGTVACLGGWINIGTRNNYMASQATGTNALRKLGIDRVLNDSTFNPLYIALSNLFSYVSLTPKAVIEELDKILEAYAAELKALPVEVKPWPRSQQ